MTTAVMHEQKGVRKKLDEHRQNWRNDGSGTTRTSCLRLTGPVL
ncbi:MAG: hypothetical protein ACK56I_19820 [bacterium]